MKKAICLMMVVVLLFFTGCPLDDGNSSTIEVHLEATKSVCHGYQRKFGLCGISVFFKSRVGLAFLGSFLPYIFVSYSNLVFLILPNDLRCAKLRTRGDEAMKT